MSKIILCIAVLVLFVKPSMAEPNEQQPNYGFTATSNQDEIFLAKCMIYRSALEHSDMSTLETFVEPALLESKPDAVRSLLMKTSKNFIKRISMDGYELKSMIIKPVNNPNYATVGTLWDARAGMYSGNGSCGYTKLANGTWRIKPSTF
jgi:hypothetical protein